MLVTGIKSKPVYAPLSADIGGRYHLMLGRGPGADALLRVLSELGRLGTPALQKTRVLLVPDAGAPLSTVPFDHLGLGLVSLFPDTPALLEAFRLVLGESLMGTRLYVA